MCMLHTRAAPELLAEPMHIQLIVVAAPNGGIVGTSVYVHGVGQGMVAASCLHHLQWSIKFNSVNQFIFSFFGTQPYFTRRCRGHVAPSMRACMQLLID